MASVEGRTWRIPPPQSGGLYTPEEVAEILGIKLGSLKNYVSLGGKRAGKLRTLKQPSGHVLPFDLAEYIKKVNKVRVEIVGKGKPDDNG